MRHVASGTIRGEQASRAGFMAWHRSVIDLCLCSLTLSACSCDFHKDCNFPADSSSSCCCNAAGAGPWAPDGNLADSGSSCCCNAADAGLWAPDGNLAVDGGNADLRPAADAGLWAPDGNLTVDGRTADPGPDAGPQQAEVGQAVDGRLGEDIAQEVSFDLEADVPSGTLPDAQPADWVDDCRNKVGRYAGGIAKPGVTAAFEKAYLQYFPQLGCPYDNLGSEYVHPTCAEGQVQDFWQQDASLAIDEGGKSMLILNPGFSQAFLLYDKIWHAYACMGTDACKGMGGLSLLGLPTSDRYSAGGVIRQDFEWGWMSLDSGGSGITVHMSRQRTITPANLSGCLSDRSAPKINVVPDESCTQPMTFDNPTPEHGDGLAAPNCSLDENGSVVLQYSDLKCPATDKPTNRGCVFMHNQDLARFDPEAGGLGVYEIFFCVEGPVNGSINLWYEREDDRSSRRYLPLLAGGEPLQGCRRAFVGPGDVNHSTLNRPGLCTAVVSGEATCKTVDGGAADARGKDAAVITPSRPSDASGVDAVALSGAENASGFRNSKLVLMNEWCDSNTPSPANPSPVKITLVSLIYHPAECLCRRDDDCQSGSSCRRVTWPAEACCMCDCPGFCE
jgi:hypothetical protein